MTFPSSSSKKPPSFFPSQQTEEMLLRQRYAETLTDLLDRLQQDAEALGFLQGIYPELLEDLAANGLFCLELEQPLQAYRVFEFLLQHGESPLYHAAFADCLVLFKKDREAMSHYQRTIELAPDIPDAYFNLAELFLMEREITTAISWLETMLSLDTTQGHPLESTAQERLRYAKEAMNSPAPDS
jgi:tetratricopeptide (TPR) repeat protein